MSSTAKPVSPVCIPVPGIDTKRTVRPAAGIRANLAWMVTGTVWAGVCQWCLLMVLAKLGTVDMVGSFTLGMAIALPVLMFSCLNLRNLYVTDYGGEFRFADYLALRIAMAAASVALVAGVAAASGYKPELVAAITLIGLAKAIEYVSDILYGLLQRQESMAAMSISMILRGTLSLMGLGLGVYLGGTLILGALGMVCAAAFTLLGFDAPVSLARFRTTAGEAVRQAGDYAGNLFAGERGGFRKMRSLAYAGAPLGAVLMLVSLNVNIPRYFVERSLGIREQGIFSSLANLIAAGSVFINALGQCVTPRLAKYFAAGDMISFRKMVWALVATSLGLGAAGLTVALTFGREALTLIYRPEYATRQDILVWLMAASGAIYLGSTMGVAMTAVRCLKPQLPLFAISAAATALACWFLVPTLGLRGAAISIFFSALIQSAGGSILLRNACKMPRPAAALAA